MFLRGFAILIIPGTVSFPKVTWASSIHLSLSLSLSCFLSHQPSNVFLSTSNAQALFCYWLTTYMWSLLQTLRKFSFSDHFCTGRSHHHIMKFSGLKLVSSPMSLQFMVSCCFCISVYVIHFSVVFQGPKMQFFCLWSVLKQPAIKKAVGIPETAHLAPPLSEAPVAGTSIVTWSQYSKQMKDRRKFFSLAISNLILLKESLARSGAQETCYKVVAFFSHSYIAWMMTYHCPRFLSLKKPC